MEKGSLGRDPGSNAISGELAKNPEPFKVNAKTAPLGLEEAAQTERRMVAPQVARPVKACRSRRCCRSQCFP